RRVLYDSAGRIDIDQELDLRNQPAPRTPLVDSQRSFLTYGTFLENGQEWIYVSRRILDVTRGQPGQPPVVTDAPGMIRVIDYVVATPRPQQTIRRVVDNFGETLFLPLCQAGIIGMVIAAALSIWISRSVAKPLQGIAAAAGRVAAGDYQQRVPVTGPTEARIVAQAFNEMTAQVQETQQAQQDFLANVTHDLRTPLTSIQGFSQAIMDGVAAQPETAQHSAQIINEEASRLNRLVNDLLDIAKIQAGRLQMLRQAVEVDRLLRMVGESMTIKAQQKNIQLHMQIPALQRIAGDGDRLAQVFTNLVDNAVKHTDPGGQVWLMAKPEQNGILVRV
ncbi:MAG TPA: HAMP domain-containing sensor histidine kinase, partial [Aggregatilineales bacterium]|nr:HAMP domain-containing sensor histidine kinase [Aggregatilineales bacterium]